jgi:hypothetical protein
MDRLSQAISHWAEPRAGWPPVPMSRPSHPPSSLEVCPRLLLRTTSSSLAGFAKWDIVKDTLSPAFVGSYDEGENLIAAKYDSAVSPHLSSPSAQCISRAPLSMAPEVNCVQDYRSRVTRFIPPSHQ